MPSDISVKKTQSSYVCRRCNSKVLSILNHPVELNMVIETAKCPQCHLVWQDQWILPVITVPQRQLANKTTHVNKHQVRNYYYKKVRQSNHKQIKDQLHHQLWRRSQCHLVQKVKFWMNRLVSVYWRSQRSNLKHRSRNLLRNQKSSRMKKSSPMKKGMAQRIIVIITNQDMAVLFFIGY